MGIVWQRKFTQKEIAKEESFTYMEKETSIIFPEEKAEIL